MNRIDKKLLILGVVIAIAVVSFSSTVFAGNKTQTATATRSTGLNIDTSNPDEWITLNMAPDWIMIINGNTYVGKGDRYIAWEGEYPDWSCTLDFPSSSSYRGRVNEIEFTFQLWEVVDTNFW